MFSDLIVDYSENKKLWAEIQLVMYRVYVFLILVEFSTGPSFSGGSFLNEFLRLREKLAPSHC
jgi:hypothetical protein